MVEKAVQTLQVDRSRQRMGSTASQEQGQHWERRRLQRTRGEGFQARTGTGNTSKHAFCSDEIFLKNLKLTDLKRIVWALYMYIFATVSD